MDDHRDDVWRFLAAVAGPQEADDCFQETFLVGASGATRSSGTRDEPQGLGHDDRVQEGDRLSPRQAPGAGPGRRGARDRGRARTEGPDDELWGAVRALPPMQRAAVAYRYVNDLPYKRHRRSPVVLGGLGATERAGGLTTTERGVERMTEPATEGGGEADRRPGGGCDRTVPRSGGGAGRRRVRRDRLTAR